MSRSRRQPWLLRRPSGFPWFASEGALDRRVSRGNCSRLRRRCHTRAAPRCPPTRPRCRGCHPPGRAFSASAAAHRYMYIRGCERCRARIVLGRVPLRTATCASGRYRRVGRREELCRCGLAATRHRGWSRWNPRRHPCWAFVKWFSLLSRHGRGFVGVLLFCCICGTHGRASPGLGDLGDLGTGSSLSWAIGAGMDWWMK